MIQSTIDKNGITETNVNDYLKEIGSISYYACHPVIYSFLNSSIRRCFFLDNELVVRKRKINRTHRICFRGNDLCFRENDEVAEKVGAQSYTYLPEKRNVKDTFETEYIYDNKYVIKLKNKNVRNSYNNFLKHHNVEIVDLSKVDNFRLFDFIDKWNNEHKHYWRLVVNRDYTLLDLKSKLFGTVVIDLDKDKVVGYEINAPHIAREDMCVNIFRKALNQYKNADSFVKVEGSRRMLEKGFRYSNDSTADTTGLKAFKERFMGDKGFTNNIFYSNISNNIPIPKKIIQRSIN